MRVKVVRTLHPEVGDKVKVHKGDTRGFSGLGVVTSVPYGGYPSTRYGVRIGGREEYIRPQYLSVPGYDGTIGSE